MQNDPIYQQGVKQVDAQTACWMKEIRSERGTKMDLQTAAYSVMARCARETLQYKEWSAQNSKRTPSQFAEYWELHERGDLEQVKKLLAIRRTQQF